MNKVSMEKEINKLQQEISRLKELIGIVDSESSSFKKMVFKKYIGMESTTKVAKYLRENGYKKLVGDKQYSYKPEDIRDIVLDNEEDVPEILKHYCSIIFEKNSKAARRYWG